MLILNDESRIIVSDLVLERMAVRVSSRCWNWGNKSISSLANLTLISCLLEAISSEFLRTATGLGSSKDSNLLVQAVTFYANSWSGRTARIESHTLRVTWEEIVTSMTSVSASWPGYSSSIGSSPFALDSLPPIPRILRLRFGWFRYFESSREDFCRIFRDMEQGIANTDLKCCR